MKTALRVTVALSALTLALTGCSSDRDEDSNIESLPTSSASAPATSSASPEETSSAAPETPEEMPGAEGPPAAGAPLPEEGEQTENTEGEAKDEPAAPASQAPVVAPAPIQPPTGADIPKGGGDVTGSLLKASNADKIKDFVKKATVDSEGKVVVQSLLERPKGETLNKGVLHNSVAVCAAAVEVFRTADDGPSVVTVLDTSGAVIATNTPKDKPFEECSWIG